MERWGTQLADGLKAYEADHYETTADIFLALIKAVLQRLADCGIAWRGQTYRRKGSYEEALADFNRAIELDPSSDWNLYQRGVTHHLLQRSDDAKADLSRAIELAQQEYDKSPKDCQNTFNLGLYYLARGQSEQAKAVYKKALAAGPTAGQIQAAAQDLKELIQLFPGHKAAKTFHQGLLQRLA